MLYFSDIMSERLLNMGGQDGAQEDLALQSVDAELYALLATDAWTHVDELRIARESDRQAGIGPSHPDSSVGAYERFWRETNGLAFSNNLGMWFRESYRGTYDAFSLNEYGNLNDQAGAGAIRDLATANPSFYAAACEQQRLAHALRDRKTEALRERLSPYGTDPLPDEAFASLEVETVVESLHAEMYVNAAHTWLLNRYGETAYYLMFPNPTNE